MFPWQESRQFGPPCKAATCLPRTVQALAVPFNAVKKEYLGSAIPAYYF